MTHLDYHKKWGTPFYYYIKLCKIGKISIMVILKSEGHPLFLHLLTLFNYEASPMGCLKLGIDQKGLLVCVCVCVGVCVCVCVCVGVCVGVCVCLCVCVCVCVCVKDVAFCILCCNIWLHPWYINTHVDSFVPKETLNNFNTLLYI